MNSWDEFKNRLIGLRGLAFIGFGDTVGSAISAVFWFYIASVLTPSTYGEIHYFLGVAGIASTISLIGTQNTIIVYTSKDVKIQSTLYIVSLIIGIISSLIIIGIFYRIDVGLIVLAYIINTLAIGDLLGRKLFSQYSKFVLIQKVLTLLLGIAFYFIFGSEGIIYALAISYGLYLSRIYKVFSEIKINFRLIIPRLGFILNNYSIGLVGGVGAQIDKIIIAPLLGYVILGNYNLALQVIVLLTMFSTILFKYLLPHEYAGNQNLLLKKFAIIISTGISIFGITIMPLLIPALFPKYLDASLAIQIMSVGVVISTIEVIYASKFLGLEKSRFVLVSGLIALLVMVVGMLVLGPLFGTIGAAITYVLAVSSKTIYLVCVNQVIK